MSWNKMDGHSSTSSSVQSVQGDGGDSKENIQPPKFSIYGTEITVLLSLSKLSQTLTQKIHELEWIGDLGSQDQ